VGRRGQPPCLIGDSGRVAASVHSAGLATHAPDAPEIARLVNLNGARQTRSRRWEAAMEEDCDRAGSGR
jgi:hypothetical protein